MYESFQQTNNQTMSEMPSCGKSYSLDYGADVIQINGCRMYGNPPKGWLLPTPDTTELFVKNLPRNMLENDILPHFDRFGQIYSFRLLMDYDHLNRGYGYLRFTNEKSTLLALDTMNYYIPKTGSTLEIQKSYEKNRLFVTNFPAQIENSVIREVLRTLFPELSTVFIKRPKEKTETGVLVHKNLCSALVEFPDHTAALRAKQFGSTGALNLWNRTIKVLWAKPDVKENSYDQSKNLVIHNMPNGADPDVFYREMCNFIYPHEILCVSPLDKFWLLEFANHEAASCILEIFQIRQLQIEWCTRYHYIYKVDPDAELRLQCIANYWDMPVFIYGRVVRQDAVQTVAVIIKNLRKNLVCVFFIEINYDKLIEIHSKICEIVMKCITNFGNLPKHHLVLKCQMDNVIVVGSIVDLEHPVLIPPTAVKFDNQTTIYLAEVYDLAAMCFKLCTISIDEMYLEYQNIIQKKSMHHQFITNIISNNRILGCIDPKYRKCKRLKIGLSNRQMILVLCDVYSKNNVNVSNDYPPLAPIKIQFLYSGQSRTVCLRYTQFILQENSRMQSLHLHNCYRNHIEYGNGYDYWCMPIVESDPEKTPTPQNINNFRSSNNMNAMNQSQMVDEMFFGHSSNNGPLSGTAINVGEFSRMAFGFGSRMN